MPTIESIIRDVGTTPERFVFVFVDGSVIAVVNVDELPYYARDGVFEASMTRESFIEDGERIRVSEVPTELFEALCSSKNPIAHVGDKYDRVPEKYLESIRELS